jgi:hypothetical protein
VQSLAQLESAARQPQLDGGVDILLLGGKLQLTALDRRQRRDEVVVKAGVIPRREQPSATQTNDVTEATEDIEAQQPRVPVRIVADGVSQGAGIGRSRRGPQGFGGSGVHGLCGTLVTPRQARGWPDVTGQIVTGQGRVEATGGANLVEGNPLVGGVRDAAVARPALDRIEVTQKDPVRTGGAAIATGVWTQFKRSGQEW